MSAKIVAFIIVAERETFEGGKDTLIFNLVNNRKTCERNEYILTGSESKADGWFVTRVPSFV